MTVQCLLQELEAQVGDELAAQTCVLAMLDQQEQAIKSGAADQIVKVTADIEAQLKSSASRGRRRQTTLRKLSRTWSVPLEALTLSSIVERARSAGINTNRLASLRGELRATMAQVVKRSRLMGLLARTNAQILHEAIETVLKAGNPRASSEGGALVNAEG